MWRLLWCRLCSWPQYEKLSYWLHISCRRQHDIPVFTNFRPWYKFFIESLYCVLSISWGLFKPRHVLEHYGGHGPIWRLKRRNSVAVQVRVDIWRECRSTPVPFHVADSSFQNYILVQKFLLFARRPLDVFGPLYLFLQPLFRLIFFIYS